MIIFNPQDLTPVLASMRAELKNDLETLATSVQNQNSELSQNVANSNQSVVDSIDALSVVNGEISTEVQAINAHTTKAVKTIQPKEKVFEFIESVSGSANFKEYTAETKVALDIQGEGFIRGLSVGTQGVTSIVEIDGERVDGGYLSYMLSKSGLRFSKSIKVTFSRPSRRYSTNASAHVYLGNYVWES